MALQQVSKLPRLLRNNPSAGVICEVALDFIFQTQYIARHIRCANRNARTISKSGRLWLRNLKRVLHHGKGKV
jgi:hypothetical protein